MLFLLALVACGEPELRRAATPLAALVPAAAPTATPAPTPIPTPTATPTQTQRATATPTAVPTATATPTPAPTATATPTPTRTPPPPSLTETYKNETVGFSISYPSGWQVGEDEDVVSISHPLGTTITVGFAPYVGESLEEVVALTLAGIKEGFEEQGFVFEETSRTKSMDPESYVIEGKIEVPGAQLKIRVESSGAFDFVVMLIVRDALKDAHQPILDNALATFQTFPGSGLATAAEVQAPTTALRPAPLLDNVRLVAKWGAESSGDGQLRGPRGIAVVGSGNVYVADISRVKWFSPKGEFQGRWGSLGKGDGQFEAPSGIAVDGSGSVYVVDARNSRVQVFGPTGEFLSKWGSKGSGDGQFSKPKAIAVDTSGKVYVADTENRRVQVFSGAGEFLAKWGSFGSGDGQFSIPSGIAVDVSGNVYVADTFDNRLQVFNTDGDFLGKWGSEGIGDGQFSKPEAIAVDGSGNVYVADTGNSRVQVFTAAGEFIGKWGSMGSADGQFRNPLDIAVAGSGTVYVADKSNQRVQAFQVDLRQATAAAPRASAPVPLADNVRLVTKWGAESSGDGQVTRPKGIAVDGSGNVYVADTLNDRVQVFNVSGDFLAEWGAEGGGEGRFSKPDSIAVDGTGNVYVLARIHRRRASG